MSVCLQQLWEVLSEKREISSGMGPLASSLREGTLSLYQQTLSRSYWGAKAPNREYPYVCKQGKEEGAAGAEGSSGSAGAWIQ